MRTLKLTDEQISKIQNALGIAEMYYTNIFKDLSEATTVRNNNEATKLEDKNKAKEYFKKACSFADINIDLNNIKKWQIK